MKRLEKQFFLKSILLFFISINLQPASSAQDTNSLNLKENENSTVKLPISKVNFDLNAFVDFEKLDVLQSADLVRKKYGIKVVFVSFENNNVSSEETNPNLSMKDLIFYTAFLGSAQNAAQVFSGLRNKDNKPLGAYLEPYFFIDKIETIIKHPYYGEHVIILNYDVLSKTYLLHELTHFLLEKAYKTSYFQDGDLKIHPGKLFVRKMRELDRRIEENKKQ